MINKYNPNTRACANLGMEFFESRVVIRDLQPFVKDCYTLEGDGSIILQAQHEYQKVESVIDNGYDMTRFDKAAVKALLFICSVDTEIDTDSRVERDAATQNYLS
eukprot:CAMPEP_0172524144 /NCGR_PEP_ID=MMETSP1066-20121228/294032_1 /TAXON_ID=671091 /ORGANISM="Coscinodiscus wailesii, Strain CCMP2513" /LENGTH=104 /DNA_ID=CAMNT_0013307255 /DNA_START=547 /DNA_END=861 /DNA_ORIENTATION=-